MTITFEQYQARSKAVAFYPRIRIIVNDGEPIEAPWLYPLLGLLGESGELAEKFKKLLRDDSGLMTKERAAAITLERGDVQWYQARLAEAGGSTLAADAEANLEKLGARQRTGTLGGDGDDR